MEYYEAQAQKLEQTIEPQNQMRFSNMFDIKEFWQIFVKYLIQRFVNEKNKDEIQVKNAQTDEDNNTRIMKALIIIRLRQAVCEQFILFETLLNDGFSTDRIIYDKIANIEAIK